MADKVYSIAFKTEGMSEASKEINKLLAETNKYNKSLKENSTYFSQVVSEVDGFKQKDLAGHVDKTSNSFFGFSKTTIAASAAFASFTALVTKGIVEAIEAEKEVTKLNSVLKVSGNFSKEASDGIQDWADKLEKQTTISGEAILANTSYAISLGYSADQAKRLTSIAINLSQVTGGSLETSTNQLIGTLDGTGGKLNQLVVGFSDLTKAQLVAGKGVDFLEQKLSGLAETNANSVAGSLTKVKIQFDDIFKDFGTQIISTDDFKKAMVNLGTAVKQFATVAKDTAPVAIDIMSTSLRGLGYLLREVNDALGIKQYRQYIDINNEADEALNNKLNTLQHLRKEQAELNKAQREAAEWGQAEEAKAMQPSIDKLREKIKELKTETDQLKELKKVRDEAEAAAAAKKKGGGTTKIEGSSTAITEDQSKINAQKQAEILKAQQDTSAAILQNQLQTYAMLDENERIQYEKGKAFNAYKFESDMVMYGEENAIRFQMEEQRIAQMEQGRLRELAMEKLMSDKAVAIKKKEVDDKKKLQQQNLQDTDKLLGTLSGLMASSSVELFEIGKAAAIAQAVLSSYESISTSFAFGSRIGGPILGGVFAAAAGVAQLVRIKQIQATKPPKKNALGGIVDYGQAGNDTATARVNRNELILNPRQTAQTLFTIANGGGVGGGIGGAVLVEIRDILATRDNNTYLDGTIITKRTNELNARILK